MGTIISRTIRVEASESGTNIFLVEVIFDLGEYLRAQIEWAVNCPLNRNGVREANKWSDEELDKPENKKVLFRNFVDKHGIEWFQINLRPKFLKTRERSLDQVSLECLQPEVHMNCKRCSECPVWGVEFIST